MTDSKDKENINASKQKRPRLVMLILFGGVISYFLLPVGCQQILNGRVANNGSTVPRNYREQIIFDYFHALQAEEYAEAYKLRGYDDDPEPDSSGLKYFTESHIANRSSFATRISIGEEEKIDASDDQCGYVYTVYSTNPKSGVLRSGEVALESKPDAPGECIIVYNSAFGSAP